MRRMLSLGSALLALLAIGVGVTSSVHAETTVQEKTVGGYRIRMLSDEDRAPHAFRLEIWRDGRLVLARNAGSAEHLELPDWAPPDAADLTGRGRPDLVVEEDTGGQCCRTALIYELGPTAKLVAKIDAQENERIDFEHRPDLGWVARLNDWTFMSWNTGFVSSPTTPIAIAYRGGEFHLVPELMRTPPWSPKLIDQAVYIVRSDFAYCARGDSCLPPPLWAVMLSLVYSGHLDQAQQFLERAWPMQPGKAWKQDYLEQQSYPASEAGRQKFWHQFMAQVANSPYWADLHAMNKLPPLPGTLDRMPDMPASWLGLGKMPKR